MQRFLASSSFTKRITSSNNVLSHQYYKAFTSLCRPAQNQFLSSSFVNPLLSCRSHHNLSWKFFGVVSNPIFVKQYLSNLSSIRSTVANKSIVDSRVWFFRAQNFRNRINFEPGFGFQRRGWRSWFQQLSANDVVIGLILANVAVFLSWRMFNQRFMANNFTISLDNIRSGRVHTIVTSAFSHIDAGHIISNMIGLYFFGMNIARNFGPEYLLKLYLAGAIGGSIFYLVHHAMMASSSKGRGMFSMDPSRAPGLGASGAVNAIMLLDIFLHPRSTLYLEFFIPVPAMLLGIFLIGKDVLRIIEGDSHISGSAHLGGAAVAALAWARLKRGRF